MMNTNEENKVRDIYKQLLEGWNNRDAEAMCEPFAEDGELIGYDGSQVNGKMEIISHLHPIFANHPTGAFVAKPKEIRFLAPDVAVLRAIAGMVLSGQSDLHPEVNTHHTLVAAKREDAWRIILFQNTPAQFHGRPHLVQEMTDELREWMNES
ncbi:MAG: hypothetical protein K0Q81_2236 [Paenibacillus sp.]|jgi:uncharacterized protein (TIGR02246 family)|nr:hypothetical protein [Paenibacillus sp.]